MRDHSISMIHTGKWVRSSRQVHRCNQSFWRAWSRLLLPGRIREGIPCSQSEQNVLSKRQCKELPAKKEILQGVKNSLELAFPWNQQHAGMYQRDVPVGSRSLKQVLAWLPAAPAVLGLRGGTMQSNCNRLSSKKSRGGGSSLSAGRQLKS